MNKNRNQVLMVTPYFPSSHYLAQYSENLLCSFKRKFNTSLNFLLCAVSNNSSRDESKEVYFNLNLSKRKECFDLAEHIINSKEIAVVVIQFDLDWCNDDRGENLLLMIYSINKPVILVIHKLPSLVSHWCKQLLGNLISAASAIVTTKENYQDLLEKEFGISSKKLSVINEQLPFDEDTLGITNEDIVSISSDKMSLAYTDLIRKYLKNKELEYQVPEISLEFLRKINNNNNVFADQLLLNRSFLNISGIIRVIYLYYKITDKFYSHKLLEIYLMQLSDCIRNNIENFETHQTISGKQEQDIATAFCVLAEILSIKNEGQVPDHLYDRAKKDCNSIFEILPNFKNLSALATSIKALYLYNNIFPDKNYRERIIHIADKLIEKYYRDAQIEEERAWTENFYRTASSKLSEALLYAYMSNGKEIYKVIAIITFDWLIANLFRKNSLGPVSEHITSSAKGYYGSEPIEVTEVITTLHLFHESFQDKLYRDYLEIAFSWYAGNNNIRTPIYYSEPDICFDGISASQLIPASSDISAISYLIARLVLKIDSLHAQGLQRKVYDGVMV